jgi:hypothetical protein
LLHLQQKLGHFRIKELKDALHQLGLPKQGKKQVCHLPLSLSALLSTQSTSIAYIYPGNCPETKLIDHVFHCHHLK